MSGIAGLLDESGDVLDTKEDAPQPLDPNRLEEPALDE